MVTEDYVPFEIAKLLKEKGFDELCYQKYDSNGELSFNHVGYVNSEKPCDDFYALAPTLQTAMKWLREVHKVFIDIVHLYENKHTYFLYRYYSCQRERYVQHTNPDYPTYEQACEAALKYCLENLI